MLPLGRVTWVTFESVWEMGIGVSVQILTHSLSLCCLDCAIDEISESRRHLPVPSLDHSAPQQLTHISGTAHLQFLRQPLLRDSGPAPQKLGQADFSRRSEEHTSELQSPMYLVCRLLLEKKKI